MENEIELLCIKAYASTSCPIKQQEVVQKRVWLKSKIIKLFNDFKGKDTVLANVGCLPKDQGANMGNTYQ
jgi:hypothetical protein